MLMALPLGITPSNFTVPRTVALTLLVAPELPPAWTGWRVEAKIRTINKRGRRLFVFTRTPRRNACCVARQNSLLRAGYSQLTRGRSGGCHRGVIDPSFDS